MKTREERIKIIRDYATFAPDEWVGSNDEFEANENELAGKLADALTEPVTEEEINKLSKIKFMSGDDKLPQSMGEVACLKHGIKLGLQSHPTQDKARWISVEDILNELQSIHNYMELKGAVYGFGQIGDLIKKLTPEPPK